MKSLHVSLAAAKKPLREFPPNVRKKFVCVELVTAMIAQLR